MSVSQNLYTTRLDASTSKISRSDADRIAAEIMAGDTTNRHLAEERGRALDDSGVRARRCLGHHCGCSRHRSAPRRPSRARHAACQASLHQQEYSCMIDTSTMLCRIMGDAATQMEWHA